MFRFMQQQGFGCYADLYQWSIDESAAFWEALCEFCDVRFDTPAGTTLSRPDNIMDAGWFAGSELNFAAHLLRERGEPFAGAFGGDARILVAINQQMSEPDATIADDDEIAFFPPVTGG